MYHILRRIAIHRQIKIFGKGKIRIYEKEICGPSCDLAVHLSGSMHSAK